jgi:hypothetical protein
MAFRLKFHNLRYWVQAKLVRWEYCYAKIRRLWAVNSNLYKQWL